MSGHTSGELIGGRYALGELLGVGGTGSVFAATDLGEPESSGADPAASARVAVKLLHPHLCADEASRDAFLREARHAMGLQHPNVVRVHGAGLHDAAGVTMPWIALDLLDGPTLRDWVDEIGTLSVPDAAALADGLLAGLAAAHAAGIVHRDISPQNVILQGMHDRRGGEPLAPEMVRIVDFGLADVTGRSTLGSDVLLAAAAGEAASVVGNASFMSPEQAQGRPVRSVSDLYQAGAVLYFALTGQPPFPRATTAQVLEAHVSAPPPVPSALVPGVRAFDRIVVRALAKTPAHRFRDAAEFRAAVQTVADAARASGARTNAAGAVASNPGDAEAHSGAGAAGAPGFDGASPDAATDATRVLPGGQGEPLGYLSPASAPPSPAPSTAGRSAGGLAAGVVGVLVLALAGWAVAAASAQPDEPVASASPSVSVPIAAEPPPEPTAPTTAPVDTAKPEPVDTPEAPEPPPATVAVPALYGSLADAEADLLAVGLVLGAVNRVESPEASGWVLGQHPSSGAAVAPGSAVGITVASGTNVVPQVHGMTAAAARAVLESAGFTAATDPADASSTAVVTGSHPAAGTVLRVGVAVTLVVAPPPTRTPTPTATSPAGAQGQR